MSSKVKILLDSDVVIHFIKGGCLSLLPRILPAYRFVILDLVLNEELRKNSETRRQIDNHLHFIKNIEVIAWAPDYEMMAEYGRLSPSFPFFPLSPCLSAAFRWAEVGGCIFVV